MKHAALPVCLLALVFLAGAGPASASGDLAPVSEQALHFRAEVGVEPGHIVCGWLDESKGTGKGYDTAVLDTDGDGKGDERQVFPLQENRVTKKRVPRPTITFQADGAVWTLDLYSLGYRRPNLSSGKVETYLRWSVRKDGLYAWFINGKTTLYTDREAAARSRPVRLGPPFRFEVGATTRGMQSLVRVGLKDGNGCTMRLARVDGAERRIRVVLRSGEKEVLAVTAEYG